MFNLEAPFQTAVSFGQVAVNICKELHRRGETPHIFPISQAVDLKAFNNLSPEFLNWLETSCNTALQFYSNRNPSLRLWHIAGSHQSISQPNYLFTMFELDSLTPTEINILKNQAGVFVSSKYTQELFVANGVNAIYCPLGFDSDSFKVLPRTLSPDVTVWTVSGKLEPVRKAHAKILKAWVKRFGNQKEHVLHCSLFNTFLKPEDQNTILSQIFEGKRYWNINFLPHTQTNEAYNTVLNATDIHLSLSGGEGCDLPCLQSLCLGKNAIVLNAHVYKDYTTKEMVTYVEPSGMKECYDGIFFHKGQAFNQGSFYDFNEADLITAFDVALAKHKAAPVNQLGLELANKFTWKNTVDILLDNLK
jgi:hypothetical protein